MTTLMPTEATAPPIERCMAVGGATAKVVTTPRTSIAIKLDYRDSLTNTFWQSAVTNYRFINTEMEFERCGAQQHTGTPSSSYAQ
mmetsp:Transcript_75494/g.138154  ORF Transcript_75494/g.138154 Transcript_75494/m.138154 type:complete len:85 (+) Transcript_75494:389-643(+)